MSKRRHNFGTKRFKEKSLFIFHARIALKSLILLFVRLIARGARIRKTHRQTDRQTDRTSTVTLAHARRGLIINAKYAGTKPRLLALVRYNSVFVPLCSPKTCKDVFNPSVTIFQSNCAEGLHFSAFHSVCVSLTGCVCFPYSGTSRNQAYKQQYQRLQCDTGMKYKKGFFFKTLRSEVMASFTHLE